ncbi:MAG: 16S rRNA (guanine(527)-N(7))-methyltransferase RsmG [Ectothiorhodospiraceae bacterium]|nr:16S rRNA (guanine(527)-N(7))-methyltransferase RsmG [Ectothiorhodospiraceae bacterium]
MPHAGGLRLDPFIDYLELLHRWNRAYNLSAVRDPVDMVPRHLLDSLSVLPYLLPDSLLDVGSGAGLPGIPLAIARPDLDVVLLDSNGKKTRFMTQAVLELGLNNVTVVHTRIQAYRPERKFATIISRAYSRLDEFAEQAARLLTPDGVLLAMKGRFDAVTEAPGLSPDVYEVIPLQVPGLEASRTLVRLAAQRVAPPHLQA